MAFATSLKLGSMKNVYFHWRWSSKISPVGVSSGTFSFSADAPSACAVDPKLPPRIATTLSRLMRRRARLTAWAGLLSSLRTISSRAWPFTPPAALTSSWATSRPAFPNWPSGATGPDSEKMTPTRIGSWA